MTIRGAFDALDEERRAALRTTDGAFRAAFTEAGTFTCDASATAFTFRCQVPAGAPEDGEPEATARAPGSVRRVLARARGVGCGASQGAGSQLIPVVFARCGNAARCRSRRRETGETRRTDPGRPRRARAAVPGAAGGRHGPAGREDPPQGPPPDLTGTRPPNASYRRGPGQSVRRR
ncbi:DUF6204 family protein [Streptomyces sp. RFCAC02]|uniref:DUF6204 family protein n=1 Tax=Streptomyces sp. RFCAC02 TaxID=2499143 RepID=UPI001F0F9C7F|nr:DUF6204 family protein [Streptomyces sp. RFCAC02]